jgi:hypothetical protein
MYGLGIHSHERAFTGKASCSALSSWSLTTSGSAFASQAKRLSSRLLMLLMLKVATLTESLSVPVLLGAPKRSNRVRCSGSHYFTGGKPNQNANLYQLEKLRDAKGVYEKTTTGRARDASLPKIAKQADAVAQELIEAQKKQKK